MAPPRSSAALRLAAFAAFAALVASAPAQDPATPAPTAPAAASSVSSLFSGRAARRDKYKNGNIVATVRSGVAWLLAHQDENGRWDSEKYWQHDPKDDPCTGTGDTQYNVGITALALLAVLAQGDALHAEAANKAADWLVKWIDKEGRVVAETHDFLYSQVLLAMALVEMTALYGNARHRTAAESALRYLSRHRNPGGAWRYQPHDGDNDTSLTAWCLAAYAEAVHAGFTVPAADAGIALGWLDTVTDLATGHTGYSKRDEPSARMAGDHLERFPVEHGQAMSAAALHGRLLTGLAPDSPLALATAELLAGTPPAWGPKVADVYYWFHASAALALLPDTAASKKWEAALHKALVPSQGKAKSRQGSWDPIDVWGQTGGRVQTTAFAVLALSSPWRLERLDPVALVRDQAPMRKLYALVSGGKFGEAAGEAARVDPAAVPPPALPGLTGARWLLDVAVAHGSHRLDHLDTVLPDVEQRLALVDDMKLRFAGVPLGDKAAVLARQLRADPKVQKEAAAQKELKPLQKAYDALVVQPTQARQRQLRNDLLKFIAKHPDTKAAQLAQALVDTL